MRSACSAKSAATTNGSTGSERLDADPMRRVCVRSVRTRDTRGRLIRCRIVALLRMTLFAFVVLLAGACSALVEGGQADVATGHVTEVLQNGDHTPVGSGMPQPFQRLRIQLDDTLFRGDVIEIEWGGRR